MASEESGDEASFTDCVASGSETRADASTGRQRRETVPEMFRRAGSRRAKRSAPDRGSRSPRDTAVPAAKRPPTGPAEPAALPAVELSAGALASIQQLVNSGIAAVISTFEKKFEQIERRLSILEADSMDKEMQIKHLGEQLARQVKINNDLQAQVEGIDVNRRLASLIFTCDDFGQRSANEDAEKILVSVLNERIPGLKLTSMDIHACHRLQRDDKIIAKFMKRSTRDQIYDARFTLASLRSWTLGTAAGGGGELGSRGGRQMSPLYISESLTPHNQFLYNQLLQARKASGGTKVVSVFSRRGLVFCRTVKNGPNIRVPDEATLRRIVGGGGDVRPTVSSGAQRAAAQRDGERDRRALSTSVVSGSSQLRSAASPPVASVGSEAGPARAEVAISSSAVGPAVPAATGRPADSADSSESSPRAATASPCTVADGGTSAVVAGPPPFAADGRPVSASAEPPAAADGRPPAAAAAPAGVAAASSGAAPLPP